MTTHLDLVLQAGATYQQQLDLITSEDLVGGSARAQIRTEPSGQLICDLTAYVSMVDDQIYLDIPDDITGDLGAGLVYKKRLGVWDMFMDLASGNSYRLVEGRVTINPRVTA